jgi:hypothetical protein
MWLQSANISEDSILGEKTASVFCCNLNDFVGTLELPPFNFLKIEDRLYNISKLISHLTEINFVSIAKTRLLMLFRAVIAVFFSEN